MAKEHRGKRIFWLAVVSGFIFGTGPTPEGVFAQEKYPTKPIDFLIGYPAGGTTDICARPLAMAAGKILGQPIVIVNKPGGASAVAVATLRTEKPDG
jgi:tripartite-type tricarboxylate transporter receptor subunit TctC